MQGCREKCAVSVRSETSASSCGGHSQVWIYSGRVSDKYFSGFALAGSVTSVSVDLHQQGQ